MKISELIEKLQAIKERDGDIEVKTQTLSHYWPPEVDVRRSPGLPPWVLLNS